MKRTALFKEKAGRKLEPHQNQQITVSDFDFKRMIEAWYKSIMGVEGHRRSREMT